jgi:hypothetical protein
MPKRSEWLLNENFGSAMGGQFALGMNSKLKCIQATEVALNESVKNSEIWLDFEPELIDLLKFLSYTKLSRNPGSQNECHPG